MDARQRTIAPVDAMRRQVARVLDHSSFGRSRGPARVLAHLAERLVTTGGIPVTQLELARVLGLAQDFDPARNPLVRMHMSKLRRMLKAYAAGDGRDDAVVLELPRNSYQLRAYLTVDEGTAAIPGGSDDQLAGSTAVGDDAGGPHLHAANGSSRPMHRPAVLISEFDGRANPPPGANFTRMLASLLVAELFDSPTAAAIGPVYQAKLETERTTIADVAGRCGAAFYLDGTVGLGLRGVQVTTRLVHAATGAVHWTDWLDDPTNLGHDNVEQAAQLLAIRIADRVRRSTTPLASTTTAVAS